MIFKREYIVCLVFSFIFLVVTTIIGIIYGYSVEHSIANQTYNELSETFHETSIFSIFLNNCYIALVAFIPVYGVIFISFVSFNTGFYVGCIGQVANTPISTSFSVYFMNIVFLIEYLAYSLSLAESINLTYLAMKYGKNEFIERLRYDTWRIILLVVFLLFIGAVIEWFTITS